MVLTTTGGVTRHPLPAHVKLLKLGLGAAVAPSAFSSLEVVSSEKCQDLPPSGPEKASPTPIVNSLQFCGNGNNSPKTVLGPPFCQRSNVVEHLSFPNPLSSFNCSLGPPSPCFPGIPLLWRMTRRGSEKTLALKVPGGKGLTLGDQVLMNKSFCPAKREASVGL